MRYYDSDARRSRINIVTMKDAVMMHTNNSIEIVTIGNDPTWTITSFMPFYRDYTLSTRKWVNYDYDEENSGNEIKDIAKGSIPMTVALSTVPENEFIENVVQAFNRLIDSDSKPTITVKKKDYKMLTPRPTVLCFMRLGDTDKKSKISSYDIQVALIKAFDNYDVKKNRVTRTKKKIEYSDEFAYRSHSRVSSYRFIDNEISDNRTVYKEVKKRFDDDAVVNIMDLICTFSDWFASAGAAEAMARVVVGDGYYSYIDTSAFSVNKLFINSRSLNSDCDDY